MGNPGQHYEGPLGATRRERIHYTCPSGAQLSVEVVTRINTRTDPELADRLLGETAPPAIVDPETSARSPLHVQRLFHDPDNSLFVLILTDAHRHRELECRAALLTALASTPEHVVPDYVRRFEVVYGGAAIRDLVDPETTDTDAVALANIDAMRDELETSERALESRQGDLEARQAELSRLEDDLIRREDALAREQEALDREREHVAEARPETQRDLGPADTQTDMPEAPPDPEGDRARQRDVESSAMPHETQYAVTAAPDAVPDVSSTVPFARVEDEDLDTNLDEGEEIEPEEIEGDEVVVADQIVEEPVESVGESGSTRVGGIADVAIERWITSREPSLATIDELGRVRLAVSVPGRTLEGLLSSNLKVMLQLHRFKTHPLVTLSVGTPDGFSAGKPIPVTLFFNVADSTDRGVLDSLARDFTFQIDLFDTDYLPVRKRTITAALAPNVQYVVAAADDALERIDRNDRSYSRALIAYDDPSYDRFGRAHPERKEFREDVLGELDKPSTVRWAIHVCRRFSTAEGEDYLFLIRGYPLPLWQKRRRAVLQRAAELGLWVGNTLAGVAVADKVAASRKILVEDMAKNFVNLVADTSRHDVDDDTIRDNWTALTTELVAQGFNPGEFVAPKTEAISSELQDVASGIIGNVTALAFAAEEGLEPGEGSGSLGHKSTDELIALLGDRDRRYDAALELCRQGAPSAVRPLFSALRRMTRAEAGHVFGGLISFGKPAVPHLIETLGSRKGFLRQGASLALAALKADEGLDEVCELLLVEPTDIWKEVARALGEYGPRAVMPLVARLRDQGDNATERVAWALAHIASRGDRTAIETLASGRDPVAAGVARHGLELADLARSDNRSIWNSRSGREHTVKRAFSKRVFEAMPRVSLGTDELSGPAMALSETDLLEAADLEDDVEPLDESDLLPN